MATFSVKLVLVVEGSIVYVLPVFSLPLVLALLPWPSQESPLEFIIFSPLEGVSIELVVPEAPLVREVIGLVFPVFSGGRILPELPLVVRPILENIGSPAMSFSVLEEADVESAVIFVHSPEAIGPGSVLGEEISTA